MNAISPIHQEINRAFDAKGNAVMLLHEDLARARMRESQRVAADLRLVRRLSKARRWRRLADWVNRRAARAAAESTLPL